MGFDRRIQRRGSRSEGLLSLLLVTILAAAGTPAAFAGVVGPAVVIVKDAIPSPNAQDFSFSGSAPIGDFDLDDDADITLPSMMTFSVPAGTYTVTEAPVPGWILTDIDCDDGNSSVELGSGTATIVVDGAETVTCTFENSLAGKIIVDKVTEPRGDPTSFDFDLNIVEVAPVDSFGLTDEDPPYMRFLLPAIYEVVETVPSGWELVSETCSEGFPDDIDLSAGEEITCTFVNRTTVESNLGFTKLFDPDTIGPGSSTTLTFTITNPDGIPAGLLTFSDDLPAAITVADFPNPTSTCGGTVEATAGGSSVSFFGGSVAGFGSCEVTVDVTSATAGVHANTSNELTSTDGIAGGTATPTLATDDLMVVTTLPGFSKSFAPSTVALGGRSTLTFTIDNSANGSNILNLDFTDNLPLGMEIADPANASTDCGTVVLPPSLTAIAGTSTIVLDADGIGIFPALAAGATCTVTVDVVATGTGLLGNVSEDLLADFVPAGKASATLEVTTDPLHLTKEFTDDPVPPGSSVTLEFTITNFDRLFAATGVAFSDDLTTLVPALSGLTFSSVLANDCGGSVSGVGGTTIGLSGATVAPESSCTLRVSLSVPGGTTPGAYTNTTGAVTGTVDGMMVTGNMAEDDLFVAPVPILTKEFRDATTMAADPVVNAGDDVILRFTVTNTSTTSAATLVAFVDELTEGTLVGGGPTGGFLPFPVSVTLPPVPNPPCGVGSTLNLISLGTGRQGLSLTGGTLDPAPGAGSSCTFEVTLTIPASLPPGIYLNTTEEPTATVDGATRTGDPASDTLEVIAAPSLTKAFIGDPVAPGGTVTLEFTLSHAPDQSADATAISFTDNLVPVLAGLTATGLPLTEACDPDGPGGDPGTGTLSGTTMLTFMGGSLSPGESCTFSVTLDVPAGAAAGSYTNTTSDVGATVGGLAATSLPAEDDLDVSGLRFSKEFLGDPVIAGDTVTLRFTIENVHPTLDATITFFTDNLSAALTGLAATGAPSVNDCGGSLSGTTFLIYVGGGVLSGEMCTIEVEVLVPPGAADGTYINTTSNLSASQGGAVAVDPATDVLTVDSNLIELSKEFTDDPVAAGDPVTLEFTLTNLDPARAASAIDFTDDLGAALTGLTFDSVLSQDCGATVSGTGTDMITVDDASLAAGGSCTIRVSLTVPGGAAANIYTNTTSAVTGTIDSLAVDGDAASDELTVFDLLAFSKSFDGPVEVGETAVLTFTITNPGAISVINLAFFDDLDAVAPGLVATGLPKSDVCGTGSQIDGTSFLTFTGGQLAGSGGTCSFDVDVLVQPGVPVATHVNTTSDLTENGLAVAPPATADLVVTGPLEFSKVFLPDTIGPGSTTQLEFTITNIDSIVLAEEVAFTDVLPAGVVIATPSSALTDCTDGFLSAPDGGTTISLSGARLGLGTTCTVTVNVTAATAGTYDNLSGELTSSVGSGGTAAATLTVDAAKPGFSKSFAPAVIPPGGTSTLTFTIDNTANAADLLFLGFTDNLPAGLVVATLPNALSDCGTATIPPTVTANPGTGVITLVAAGLLPAFPALDGGATCTVTVDVTAAVEGLYENVSGELDLDPDISTFLSAGFATAVLDAQKDFLIKSFTDDPVAPGTMVTLEFEINNPSRDFPATDIEFTDTIDPMGGLTGVTVIDALPRAECGGTLAESGGVLMFSGGSLPAEGSCTFSVTLQLPAVTDGSFTNTTSSIMATIDGVTETGDPAEDVLKIVAAPVLTKEFLDATTMLPDPVVGPGDDVVIRFTISNTSTVSGATDISFVDELTTFLPFPVTVTLPPVPDPPCNGTSSLALVSLGTDRQGLELTDGVLGTAPDSCSFDVTLTLPIGLSTGTYVNTTEVITATVDAETVSGLPASDSFDLVAAPRLTKAFTDDPVQPGGTVTLEFTLEHDPNAPGDAVDVGFTDDLDALVPAISGLVATGLPLTGLCPPGDGMLVGTDGDTFLTFSGATLTPGQICTFSVTLSVPGSAEAGPHTNTTSNVVATVLGVDTTENPAEDDLIIGGLILTKEFIDDPVISGGTVTLEFVITNQTPGTVTDIVFTDVLDPDVLLGLSVASTLPLADPCGAGSSLDDDVTGNVLILTDGTLGPPGPLETDGVCTFSVTLDVPAGTLSGTYVNRTSAVSATVGGSTATFPAAQDDLVVANEQLLLTKEFTDDPVVPGGTVTLEFGISTLGAFDSASDLAFTDDLESALAGLAPNEALPKAACGGTLDFAAGELTFSGGSFTGGDCGFSVTLSVPMAVPFGTTITNTTSEIMGTIDSAPVTGEPASDDLIIDFFTFVKFFDGLTKPTGTPVLTFMITNLSTMDTITDLAFADDLDAVIPGLVATSLPVEPCGVGSSITGTSVLTMTSGTLLPGGMCTFNVDLLVPPDSGGGSFLNTTSALEVLGLPVAAPVTAFLDVDPPPLFGKAFVPDFIDPGFRSALTFLIDNSDSVFPVTDLAFTDTLPAGVTVAFSADVGSTCTGGTLTAVEGSGVISYSGGSVAAGDFCFVQVDVTATVPGSYPNLSSPLTSSSGESSAAIDTLIVVEPGGPCVAPNGENLTLMDDTVMVAEEFVVCDTIFVGPNFGIIGPLGDLLLRAGIKVVIEELVVGQDAKLEIRIEPVLVP
ncbi:MAG: beta strand repeat-containing protein [Thermoanaerobaculia bacterium]